MMIKNVCLPSLLLQALAAFGGCDFGDLCPTTPTDSPPESAARKPANAANLDVNPFIGTENPYLPGSLGVTFIDLDRCEADAPLRLRIHSPTAVGAYPVIVLQHAFQITNHSYDQIAAHIASHGFIVVLPRMYDPGIGPIIGMPTAALETERAAVVVDWIPARLERLPGIEFNNINIGLAGHSRGGKVAFGVATAGNDRVAALVGIDPVDGTGGPGGNQPRVTGEPFAFEISTLIIGAGIAGACAPEGDNYVQFFEASPSPSKLVVATDYGHGDMLDEETAALAASVCASNDDREPMRRLTAGLLVAFFRAQLQDASSGTFQIEPEMLPAAVSIQTK